MKKWQVFINNYISCIADAEVLKQLLNSSWPGLLAALNLLLEASIDDGITESICERLVDLATLSGKSGLQQCKESTVLSLCVATLPPHYGYAVLKGTIGTLLFARRPT